MRSFDDGGGYEDVKFIQVFLLDLVAEPMTDELHISKTGSLARSL